MTVYIDNARNPFGRMKMAHMIADTHEELEAMARQLGLRPKWIQHEGRHTEHYDVSLTLRDRAIALGAKPVTRRELGTILVSRRKRTDARAGVASGVRRRERIGKLYRYTSGEGSEAMIGRVSDLLAVGYEFPEAACSRS